MNLKKYFTFCDPSAVSEGNKTTFNRRLQMKVWYSFYWESYCCEGLTVDSFILENNLRDCDRTIVIEGGKNE